MNVKFSSTFCIFCSSLFVFFRILIYSIIINGCGRCLIMRFIVLIFFGVQMRFRFYNELNVSCIVIKYERKGQKSKFRLSFEVRKIHSFLLSIQNQSRTTLIAREKFIFFLLCNEQSLERSVKYIHFFMTNYAARKLCHI